MRIQELGRLSVMTDDVMSASLSPHDTRLGVMCDDKSISNKRRRSVQLIQL